MDNELINAHSGRAIVWRAADAHAEHGRAGRRRVERAGGAEHGRLRRGRRTLERGRLQVDGLSVGTAFNGAGVSAYVADVNNAQEVVLTASGGMGEAETGGPVLNLVPEGRRQQAQRPALCLAVVTEGMVEQQLHRRTESARA